jgi:hypothetical protein
VILVDSGPTTGQPSDTRRHIVLFYGGYAAGVPQGELGDPLRKIEKIMTCEKISTICVHMGTRILADGPTPKKNTQKIRRKHMTPSEKLKNRNAKSVPTYIFHLYEQRNHSLIQW